MAACAPIGTNREAGQAAKLSQKEILKGFLNAASGLRPLKGAGSASYTRRHNYLRIKTNYAPVAGE